MIIYVDVSKEYFEKFPWEVFEISSDHSSHSSSDMLNKKPKDIVDLSKYIFTKNIHYIIVYKFKLEFNCSEIS